MLVSVLQAVRRCDEADVILTEPTEQERQLGVAALPADIRAALEVSDEPARPLEPREVALDQAAAELSEAVRQRRAVIVNEEHPLRVRQRDQSFEARMSGETHPVWDARTPLASPPRHCASGCATRDRDASA